MLITHHGVTPRIAPNAYSQQSAHIIGDVHIGAESSVWFNTVVRGDVCVVFVLAARTRVGGIADNHGSPRSFAIFARISAASGASGARSR